jgi:tetratricopeptide (TPR) repeat protein
LAVFPDLGFEHRTYLPNVALAVLAGLFLWLLWQRVKLFAVLVLTAQLVIGAVVIHQRSILWNDREEFYRHELTHTADNPRPYAMVGQLFANDGRYEMATKWIKIAIQVGLEAGQLQGSLVSQYMELLYDRGEVGAANRIGVHVLTLSPGNNAKAEILKVMARNKIENGYCDMAMGLINRALKLTSADRELIVMQRNCNETK